MHLLFPSLFLRFVFYRFKQQTTIIDLTATNSRTSVSFALSSVKRRFFSIGINLFLLSKIELLQSFIFECKLSDFYSNDTVDEKSYC